MLEFNVDLSGIKDLPKLTPGQVSKVVRSVAARLRKEVVAATPVGNRAGAGTTKRSWTPVRKVEKGYSFGNPTIQSWFLEHGSQAGERPWPNPRSRTVFNHGRIYSSQAPEGISVKADADRVVQEAAVRLINRVVKGESLR
jgi:hypothetical protein